MSDVNLNYVNGYPTKFARNPDGSYSFSADPRALATLEQIRQNTEHTPPVNVLTPPKTPRPVRAEVVTLTSDHNWYLPKWMDKDGNLWGSHESSSRGLFKSEDQGVSWTKVLDPPTITVGGDTQNALPQALMISDTGRAVWCSNIQTVGGQTVQGRVFVTDEAMTEWTEVFQFDWGRGTIHYGHDKYQNILLVASYGDRNIENQQPTQVIASFDHGGTWTEIGNFGQVRYRHVHDVAYDPWADRIWVTLGDLDNSNIGYTDDRGGTWHWLWDQGAPDAVQPTAIVPTPHGIVFGSDGPPNGLHYLPRKPNMLRWAPVGADVIHDYYVLDEHNTDETTHVFSGRWTWTDQAGDSDEFYVMGALNRSAGRGYGLILASADGRSWYDIWNVLNLSPGGNGAVYTVVGPHPDDEDRHVYSWVLVEGVSYFLKLKLPDFS